MTLDRVHCNDAAAVVVDREMSKMEQARAHDNRLWQMDLVGIQNDAGPRDSLFVLV